MRIKLFPTGLATKENKKAWLVYEILRYRDFIKLTQSIKMVLMMALVLSTMNFFGPGWLPIVFTIIGLIVFDFHYELFVLWKSKDFLIEIGEACFEVENFKEHDFRVLMNRVENYVKTKDVVKKEVLYKELEDCYDGMRYKSDLKEAFDELAKKGKEQKKAEG